MPSNNAIQVDAPNDWADTTIWLQDSITIITIWYSFFIRIKQSYLTLQKETLLFLTRSLLFHQKRRLPTLPRVCSTIGADGLNFSVRNGKRWNPDTITT